MIKVVSILIFMLCCGSLVAFADEPFGSRVRLKTNYGDIVLELNSQAAPKTVENFLNYAREGFYDGTIFHRVIKGFMIQGGGLTGDMRKKEVREPIGNEADNGLNNLRGSIAMARTGEPHSATSQFFINTVDNHPLDHQDKTGKGWGYCVFGKVVEGMDVADHIENVKTASKAGRNDVPAEPVIIEQALLEE